MLLLIDDSVSDLFISGAATASEVENLKYLLMASAEGNHRLAGSRKTLRKLLDANIVVGRDKRVLERMLGRFSEDGSLPAKLSTIGRVVHGNQLILTSSTVNSQREIIFPLQWFDVSAKVQPTTLLGENLSDVGVCEHIAGAGLVLAGLQYLPLASSPASGGGSGIGNVLANFASGQRLCICITDSDKSTPTSPIGNTASTTTPYDSPTQYPHLCIVVTKGRDLENLLPNVFYQTNFGSHNVYRHLANILGELTSRQESEVRSFIDIEQGVKYFDFLDPLQSPFWTSKQNLLLQISNCHLSSLPCGQQTVCAQNSRRNCSCVITQGISTNILEQFRHFSSNVSRYTMSEYLDDSVRPEWRELGLEIGSWCCADEKVRI